MEMLLRTCAENGNTQQNTIDAGMCIYSKRQTSGWWWVSGDEHW